MYTDDSKASDIDLDMYFESRGFINNSFTKGLNPREFFMHAISGREGIVDKGLSTAKTGYIQRRLIKIMEDLSISDTCSVETPNGTIVQNLYGETGYKTELNETSKFFNIKSILENI
jgi:DNA-directed RNA polymerase beta' subunit